MTMHGHMKLKSVSSSAQL